LWSWADLFTSGSPATSAIERHFIA
jgi:hypothetical protein